MTALVFFIVICPDYRGRIAVFCLSMAIICATHVRLLAQHGKGLAAKLMLATMTWQTLILLVRVGASPWIDQPTSQRFDESSIIHTLYVGSFSFSILLMLVAAPLMASERVRLEYQHQANHDELTGLLNRRAILASIEKEQGRWNRYGQSYAVMLLDLDYFKTINDTYGHQAGDRALVNVAKILKESMREVDRIGRFGGEEFIALLPTSDASEARQ